MVTYDEDPKTAKTKTISPMIHKKEMPIVYPKSKGKSSSTTEQRFDEPENVVRPGRKPKLPEHNLSKELRGLSRHKLTSTA